MCQVRPRPLQHDGESIPEAHQKEDVDEEPHQPSEEARHAQPAEIGNGRRTSDRGHIAGIAVVKRCGGLPGRKPQDVPGGVRALLLGDLRHAGQRLTGLVNERGQVPDDEDVRVAFDREIRFDLDAPDSVERHAERRRERRAGNAGRPHDRVRDDAIGADE